MIIVKCDACGRESPDGTPPISIMVHDNRASHTVAIVAHACSGTCASGLLTNAELAVCKNDAAVAAEAEISPHAKARAHVDALAQRSRRT